MSVWNIDVGNYKINIPSDSHHNLKDLTINDDHPQYWHIPSRSTDILSITNTTDSTSPYTGALTVAGGMGVEGNINGSNITLSGSLLLSGSISSSSNITAYGTITSPTISSNGTITGATMRCTNAPIISSDVVRLGDLSSVSTSHHSLTDLTNYDDHPQYFHQPGRTGDVLTVNNTTASTTTTSGAAVVVGRVGIGGGLTVGGRIQTNSDIYAPTGEIQGTNMTCLTAPTYNTGVLRLIDIANFQWVNITWLPATNQPSNTVPLCVSTIGSNFVMLQQFSGFQFNNYDGSNMTASVNYSTATGVPPPTNLQFNIVGAIGVVHDSTAGIDSTYRYPESGQLSIDTSGNMTFQSLGSSRDVYTILPWSLIYQLS